MTMTAVSLGTRSMVLILATLMFARGLLILFAEGSLSEWSNLLGVGGLAAADVQFGPLGPILRIGQLIEGRLWIIVAFPLFFRLPWDRDVAVLVAGLGMVVQVFRLLAGSDAFAVVWLVIYAAIAALFYAEPGIRAYFAPQPDTAVKSQ